MTPDPTMTECNVTEARSFAGWGFKDGQESALGFRLEVLDVFDHTSFGIPFREVLLAPSQ